MSVAGLLHVSYLLPAMLPVVLVSQKALASGLGVTEHGLDARKGECGRIWPSFCGWLFLTMVWQLEKG